MIKLIRYPDKPSVFIIRMLGILLGLALITDGCIFNQETPEPKYADRSFITSQPCVAPCWYGLELDQSTESDVMAKLKELPFVDHENIKKNNNVPIMIYSNALEFQFGCAEPKGEICGSIYLSDGKLKALFLTIQYKLSLKSMIDRLGIPDYIRSMSYTPDGGGCEIDMQWEKKGIEARIINPKSTELCGKLDATSKADPDLNVNEIQYIEQEAIKISLCGADMNCIPWPGFKEN